MTNETDKDLLLIAEKLGSALDRIEKIETDFAVQAAPIQAAGASQDAALKSLEAALSGIKALNQHVLQNDLGLLSTKLDESGKQFEKALVAIDEKVASNAAALASKLGQVRAELAAATATRIELSAAREDAAAKVQKLAVEFTRELAQVRSELAAKAAEFSEPKGMEPAGEWESGKSFDRLAVVSYNGSSYISKTHANFEKPDARSKAWQMLARRGGSGGVSTFDGLSGVILPQQLVPGSTTFAVGDVLYAGTTGALTRLAPGTSGQLLSTQGASAAPIWVTATGGAGDMNGPASATDNALPRFDGTGGKTLQASGIIVSDTNAVTGLATATTGDRSTQAANTTFVATADSIMSNPRAAAQALAFDGTTSVAFTTPVLGTGDFCVSAVVNPSSLASARAFVGGVNNSFSLYVQTTGTLISSKTNVAINTPSTGVIAAGVVSHIAYSRLSGVGTYYINGAAAGTTTDTQNYSEAITQLGSAASSSYFPGSISGLYPYNRALTAAEVLALYQEGAPRAADYAAGLVATTVNATAMVVGRRYRILAVGTTTFTSHGASANTVGTEFIATSVGTGTGTTTAIGLLCAPDAAQPGAGLQWLDASGNRAHLTIPTSGVRWSLPNVSRQIVIEATTNTSGNQQLAGSSIVDTSKEWRIDSWTINCSTGTPTVSLGSASAGTQYKGAGALAAGNNDITLVTRFTGTANLWCNSDSTATLIHRITLSLAN